MIVNIVTEKDGFLHPIEIKKSQNPTSAMIKGFKSLKKSSIPVSMGAIICAREDLGAIDENNFIIPVGIL